MYRTRNMKKGIIGLVVLFLTWNADAQKGIGHKVDSVLNDIIESNDIKGLSIGVVFNNQIAFTKGYGSLKENDNQGEINPTTPMLSASISKTFVATAILQLQEKGLLNISDPIIKTPSPI